MIRLKRDLMFRAQVERLLKPTRGAVWGARSLLSSPAEVEEIYRETNNHETSVVRVCRTPSYIEPLHGYVVTDEGVLLSDSMRPNFEFQTPNWRLGLPPPPFRWSPSTGRNEVLEVPVAVSLRHWWEWNYHHFFVDVLGKLALLEDAGVGRDVPIVLGRYVRELPFASEALASGAFAERNWIVPDSDNRLIVRAREVIYCQTRQPFIRRIGFICEQMEASEPRRNSSERIFLTRRPPASRTLRNEEELRPIFRRYGFRTIDAANMTLKEQIATFSSARCVVALHGAGVTNIMFRRGEPLSVLELHGESFYGGGMKQLCDEFGYHHALLSGPNVDDRPSIHSDFDIDSHQLAQALENLP